MKFPLQTIRTVAKRALSILLPLFSALFLIGTTIIIMIIVNGYSIDITRRQLIKTGVLNLETNPADAVIHINSEYQGVTNKAIPNLTVGKYAIELSKDGYFPYKRVTDVKHGLATIIIAPLIKQAGADAIVPLAVDELSFASDTGFYVISPVPAGTSVPTITTTATPTSTQVKEALIPFTITKYAVQRTLFDPPRPVSNEKMTIQLPAGMTIFSFSISPKGKNVFLITQDKRGQKFAAIFAFRAGRQEEIILAQHPSLNFYLENKDNRVTWVDSSDYLLIETKQQVISYNVQNGTRVILVDKSDKYQTFIWNVTREGIVTLKNDRSTLITPTPENKTSYEIEQISFNGNPVASKLQALLVEGIPEKIWAENNDNKTIAVISTDKGTYLTGDMFDTRIGEYEITNSSTKIGDIDILTREDSISLLQIHGKKVDNVLFMASKYMISYTDQERKNLYAFTYNKRSAEHYIELGEKTLITNNENEIKPVKWIFSGQYLLFSSNRNLWAVDYTGTNLYSLQHGVNSPTFYLEDSAAIYKGDDSKLYFKLLR